MRENLSVKIKQDLQQIADMLLLNGTLTECAGLVHGKMGIAVFFFHYAKHTGNQLYADYAMDVMGEMLNQIHVNSPADYEKGIAGIGICIDYLIRNNFLDEEDDICEDFDQRMIRAVMHDPWPDFSQYGGLTGYGRYWITRLGYQIPSLKARECLTRIITLIEENLPEISITEQTDVFCFLHDLHGIPGFESCAGLLEKCRRNWDLQFPDITQCFSRLGNTTIGNIIRTYHYNLYFNNILHNGIGINLKDVPALNLEVAPTGMGLLTGYAGEGMLRLTALDKTNNSWMLLL